MTWSGTFGGNSQTADSRGSWENEVDLFAIVKLDRDGFINGWNAGAETMKGYTPEQILGSHFSAFYRASDRERDWPATLLDLARRNGSAQDTGWRVRRDGSEFWAYVTITAVHDSEHEVTGFVKIVRDLTPQKKLDDERIALQRAFAHDLISPATALRGYLDLLEEEFGADNRLLRRAMEVSDHLTAMASALMSESVETSTAGRRVINLPLVVKSAASLVLRADLNKRIVYEELADVSVVGDVLAVRRAIANVIENAAKYSDGAVHVRVSETAEAVRISVIDHGRGIDPGDVDSITVEGQRGRLADPGDGGSGLGLASVQRIVREHQGSVEIESVVGEGTTVTLVLPR